MSLLPNCPKIVRKMFHQVSTIIQKKIVKNFYFSFTELALYVLSFLHPRDLLRAAQTCRYWRILAEDNLLWREKCREAGLDDMSSDLMAFRKARRLNPAASPASTSTASPPAFVSNLSTYSPWKAGYMRQHNIEVSPILTNFDQF